MWLIVRRSLAVVFLLLWALSTVFWIRSHEWVDSIRYVPGSGSPVVLTYSHSGVLAVSAHRSETYKPTAEFHFIQRRERLDSGPDTGFLGLDGGFNVATSPTESVSYFVLPYWFLSVVSGLAGLLLTMRRQYRFTVRGMLVATAIVAVVLGLGIALRR